MSSLAMTLRAGLAGAIVAVVSSQVAADDGAGVAFFETKIRPVLVERCYECHSSAAKKPKGGLRVDSRAGMRTGGATGPAVVPGDLDASVLYQAITGADGFDPMPPKGRLPASVVADFKQWIKFGAPTRATRRRTRVSQRRVHTIATGGRSGQSDDPARSRLPPALPRGPRRRSTHSSPPSSWSTASSPPPKPIGAP